MTLNEYLRGKRGEVQIGSGSGFWYFGDMQNATKNVKKISGEIHRLHRNFLENKEKDVTRYRRLVAESKENVTTLSGEELRCEKELLVTRELKLKSAEKSLKRIKEVLDNWTPLGKREVLDTYPLLLRENVLAIIVEGQEISPWWDINEYRQAAQEKKGAKKK